MKTFLINVSDDSNSQKVMQILNDLVDQKLITYQEHSTQAVSPSYEQVEEIIDESELGPYYTEEEAKEILHLK